MTTLTSAHPVDSALSTILASYGIAVGGAGNEVLQATAALRTVFGGDGNDTITGGAENSTIYGGDGNDVITDSNGSDTIDGGAGDDVITDQGSGTNTLRGGDGNDTVYFSYSANNTVEGGAGNDVLQMSYYSSCNSSGYSNTFAGGMGNDRIVSGSSADAYLFNRGDGQDSILDADSWSNGKTDKIVFGAGAPPTESIDADHLWFRHVGNNLEVSIVGSSESVTIENWYSSSIYHVEQFLTTDNKVLLDTRVETLVQAMAAFAPPAAGQTALPPPYQDALAPVIASVWQ